MGKQIALVVGVSNYPDPSWALPGVANDAEAMAGLIASPQGHFREGHISVLTDAQATAAAIVSGLDAALSASESDDTVFVYFAGHGMCSGGGYYFLSYDTVLGQVVQTGVPLTAIKDRFEKCVSRRVFVWLDFCHSGGIIERAVPGDSADTAREVIERTLKVVGGRGKIIVTACTGSQTAKESQSLGHGFFTHALLEGLKGAAADAKGRVLATTLYNYVVDRVQSESNDQCPVWHGQMEGHIILMNHDPRSPMAQPTSSTTGLSVNAMCNGSGDWVMVGNLFLPSESVIQQGDRILVEVRPRSTEENAAVQRLHPRQGRGDTVPFAHGDDAQTARVVEVTSRSTGGQKVVTIALTPENISYGGHGMEVNPQGFTADQIAEKRAGRLLLNNPPAPGEKSRRQSGFDLVEMYIRGDSGSRFPAEGAVLSEMYAAYRERPELILPLARLKLLYALRASDSVEEVLELCLGPIQNGRCHVKFRGRRARRYSNVEPHAFTLEGECHLE